MYLAPRDGHHPHQRRHNEVCLSARVACGLALRPYVLLHLLDISGVDQKGSPQAVRWQARHGDHELICSIVLLLDLQKILLCKNCVEEQFCIAAPA
jgi:hypothetical protein